MENKTTKEQFLKDIKSKLKEYENKREELRYERNQISFTIKNCQKLDYNFETMVLRLKHELIDKQIWIIDDVVCDLRTIIEDLEKI